LDTVRAPAQHPLRGPLDGVQTASVAVLQARRYGYCMVNVNENAESAAKYRGIAEELRRLSMAIKHDYRRAAQLEALAEGFDRFAARFEQKAGARDEELA
jgi:hypothetical protein